MRTQCFTRTPLALALASGLLLAGASAHAATITVVNEGNLVVTQDADGENITYIYQQDVTAGVEGAVSNGSLSYISGNQPGIVIAEEPFSSGSNEFAGCIMARNDMTSDDPEVTAPNCQAEGDTAKRFKMSATARAPIDIVFDVPTDDGSAADTKLYRVFGKLSNKTVEPAVRFGGFQVELGFGLGDDFVPSVQADVVGMGLVSANMPLGKFPGGLFGGGEESDNGFFSPQVPANFALDQDSTEDLLKSTQMPPVYYNLFGNWLPKAWVPSGWFEDHDLNPNNDDVLLGWLRDDVWLNGDLTPYDGAGLDYIDALPEDGRILVADGEVVAYWDEEAGEDGEGRFVFTDGETDPMTWQAVRDAEEPNPYQVFARGPIEDLANVNINYYISVGAATAWPTACVEGICQFTMRITPLAEPPARPAATKRSSSSGCSIGAPGAFDPLLPALLLMALGYLALRRRTRLH